MKFYQITNKSFKELGVKTFKGLWNKVKKDHKGLCNSVDTKFKKVKSSDGKFNVVMSTASEDRHGDIVEQNFDLKSFKKNSVLLDSHNYNSIEHIVGKVNKTKVKDGKLQGETEFMRDNPKGALAEKMVDGGFINAVSIGFIPKEFDDETGNIVKSELLELSLVSVPANAEALFEKAEKKFGKEECKHKAFKKTDKGFKCIGCGEMAEDEEVEKEEVKIFKEEVKKTNPKLEALKRVVAKREAKRREYLKEGLAVIQRMTREKVDSTTRRRMANRVINRMLKIK